jgi:hypothetical protein
MTTDNRADVLALEPCLTINDLACAVTSVRLGIAWHENQRKQHGPSGFTRNEIAKLAILNSKLSCILDAFSLPENGEGETPDNGDDKVFLTWERAASPSAREGEEV